MIAIPYLENKVLAGAGTSSRREQANVQSI
jgi:hypothetical protein